MAGLRLMRISITPLLLTNCVSHCVILFRPQFSHLYKGAGLGDHSGGFQPTSNNGDDGGAICQKLIMSQTPHKKSFNWPIPLNLHMPVG